MDYNAYLFF